MDELLQRLKRASSYGGQEAKERYIAALERAVGGVPLKEHPMLESYDIAAYYPKTNELINSFWEDIYHLNPYWINDDNGERIGVMLDVYWWEAFDDEEYVKEIESSVRETTLKMLSDAADLGYKMIVFWR